MKIEKIVFFAVLAILCDYGFSIRWLSLQHSNLHWNLTSVNSNPVRGIRSGIRSPCGVARRRYGFAKLQAKLCRSSMEVMPHVQRAATLAAETCQQMFEDRRWNCSSIVTAPFLTPDLTRATREQAYVYAISSAALTYTMARACASGTLYHCTCAPKSDENPTGDFQWGGCGDNLRWGVYFAKRFIDNVEKNNVNKTRKRRDDVSGNDTIIIRASLVKRDVAAINLHNNRVGRRIIRESLQIQCKCHGVSGSCNIKTCWKGLPSMMEIGKRLMRKYTTALEVNRYQPLKKNSDQLMFISKSPDYCTKDDKLGSFGTVGRYVTGKQRNPKTGPLLSVLTK